MQRKELKIWLGGRRKWGHREMDAYLERSGALDWNGSISFSWKGCVGRTRTITNQFAAISASTLQYRCLVAAKKPLAIPFPMAISQDRLGKHSLMFLATMVIHPKSGHGNTTAGHARDFWKDV